MATTAHNLRSHFRIDAHDPATNDPLVGTQEHTDSRTEASHTPDAEVMLTTSPYGLATRSRLVAGLLGVVLGGLGFHRLYLGYRTIGLFQMGLFVGGAMLVAAVAIVTGSPIGGAILTGLSCVAVVAIWGAVEGLMILCGALNEDGDGHPLSA